LNRFTAALMALSLAGCSGQSLREIPIEPDDRLARYDARHAALSELPDWTMNGRLSVDDGEDGGSGGITWQVIGDTTRIDFHAAMGRGAWRLEMSDQGAVLETADGRVLRGPATNALLQEEIGWTVPVDALAWWARGLAAPEGGEQVETDANGLAERIVQQGWTVNYRRYSLFAGSLMPVRLNANKDHYRVKLAVSEWRFGNAD
jgi:outer membrane lipoprotein LolB